MARVFISYKRTDKEIVFPLKDKIEAAIGEPCWIDLNGIESDAQFAEVIIHAIDAADIFLFMYSKQHANIKNYTTDWTVRELNYALNKKKRIVFVNVDRTPMIDWLEFMFPQQQQVDATNPEALEKLLSDICKWLKIRKPEPKPEPKPQPKPEPKPEPKPVTPKKKKQVDWDILKSALYALCAVAVAVVIFIVSFSGEKKYAAKDVSLRTASDSINYCLGLVNGSQIKEYYIKDDVNEKTVNAFMEALDASYQGKKVAVDSNDNELTNIAISIGKAIREQEPIGLLSFPGWDTDFELIEQGFVNAFYDHNRPITKEAAETYLTNAINRYRENESGAKEQGEAFLRENAKRSGVYTTKSGLQYEVLRQGTGKKPTRNSTVKVHYEGTLVDGSVFDSSYQRGEPIEFPLNAVIEGWTEGLQLMPVGSKYKLYIPYQLGYKDKSAGTSIPPYSALIFTVELLDIK